MSHDALGGIIGRSAISMSKMAISASCCMLGQLKKTKNDHISSHANDRISSRLVTLLRICHMRELSLVYYDRISGGEEIQVPMRALT